MFSFPDFKEFWTYENTYYHYRNILEYIINSYKDNYFKYLDNIFMGINKT